MHPGGKEKATEKGKQTRNSSDQQDDCNLFVFHLPREWQEETLHKHFRPFGQIVSAIIARESKTGRNKGFGFVCYESAEDAQKAIAGMNKQYIGGKRLSVALKQQRPAPAKMRKEPEFGVQGVECDRVCSPSGADTESGASSASSVAPPLTASDNEMPEKAERAGLLSSDAHLMPLSVQTEDGCTHTASMGLGASAAAIGKMTNTTDDKEAPLPLVSESANKNTGLLPPPPGFAFPPQSDHLTTNQHHQQAYKKQQQHPEPVLPQCWGALEDQTETEKKKQSAHPLSATTDETATPPSNVLKTLQPCPSDYLPVYSPSASAPPLLPVAPPVFSSTTPPCPRGPPTQAAETQQQQQARGPRRPPRTSRGVSFPSPEDIEKALAGWGGLPSPFPSRN
uniref:RRM domain-containing protein n=1 Tax=Chromera velia CCMP2878 TaxID=1169474 RepID=A0A0G4F7M4_9ALVE|eukprot:Cvel_15589.t1-p1 / transcript=Cvel_15589.t1 / gene=Cvel_15589 / organism=Chromera_velia_CCMP2878 / gene_product=CUGBP Elav-like family member 3, putative / transcript_product=CUGBP Elav-like family member 3, putative / location=Cvel_scaffold1159:34910-36863(-) / protein_length=394 / sequence_SO=supercontig / SO=protein_coding / is_pseudo=false